MQLCGNEMDKCWEREKEEIIQQADQGWATTWVVGCCIVSFAAVTIFHKRSGLKM